MKKTLIAAGIAAVVAAPAAFADVTVSGQVKYTLGWTGEHGDTEATTGKQSFDNSLTFKASEDLGNGLAAFAQITLDTDSNTYSGESTARNSITSNKDQKLGLKGSFGTIVMGHMEYLTEGVASAKMDDGLSSHGAGAQLESSLTVFGRDDAIAYVSPTINGFHAAVAGSQSGTAGGAFDNVDVLVAYDNGPLSLIASRADVAETTSNAKNGYDVTVLHASYQVMDDLKVSAQRVKRDVESSSSLTKQTDKVYRIDYKMGNNSFILGRKNAGDNFDVTDFKATHSFSKQTAAYVGHRAKDNKGDVTYVGMIHKF